MRIVPHPLLERDIVGMADHVFAVSGDGAAARRRISDARDLIKAIVAEPGLGTTLDGDLAGWRVRHGGGGRRITIVFRHDAVLDALYVALVAFGGRDWESHAAERSRFGERGA
jgi:plasmid stabilization system protein ParE